MPIQEIKVNKMRNIGIKYDLLRICKKMVVVISLGGIFFTDTERIKKAAAAIDAVERSRHDLYVVAGGGGRAVSI